ncbi:phosphate starvation-inducible protein PhoH [Vandammella animalimorsus]|uniref:PhoH-like protein n=1 Tax=Vandammella animalimorsus TaxID=2029117 RepID=A0A2A2AIB7_9BURK|nr:phosphate starvation-inducible protein PhoH [Vandammella animalimorsus]
MGRSSRGRRDNAGAVYFARQRVPQSPAGVFSLWESPHLSTVLRHAFVPASNQRLANLVGPMESHIRTIEAATQTAISRREGAFKIEGAKRNAQKALEVLQALYEMAGRAISAEHVQLMLAGDAASVHEGEDGAARLSTRRSDLRARTPNQSVYLSHIAEHDITFGIGPAGTGKTYLAVACAVDALERNAVQRIVLTRPAVEAGERLGFLPGDLTQKVDPYLRPLYDALYELMGFERVQKAFERNALEIAPLAFMRGRTLNNAFVILDEAQNTTPEQMKMFLTRIGFGAKAVITGDASQIDLPKGAVSGLLDARRVLKNVKGIAFTQFDSGDVVRHPLVARIVDAYDRVAPRPAAAQTGGKAGGKAGAKAASPARAAATAAASDGAQEQAGHA